MKTDKRMKPGAPKDRSTRRLLLPRVEWRPNELPDGPWVLHHQRHECKHDHCRKHLASFKRPERIVVMDELPRTSTGKLLRRDLIPVLSDL